MSLEDLGIHKTQEDLCEEELLAAGWKPKALHPRSLVWFDPEGQCYPGLMYSWLLMHERKAANNKKDL
ncbi:MAG: hypothetical protein ACYDDS_19035 [Candidatus Sulfotelmatobacter sp.]